MSVAESEVRGATANLPLNLIIVVASGELSDFFCVELSFWHYQAGKILPASGPVQLTRTGSERQFYTLELRIQNTRHPHANAFPFEKIHSAVNIGGAAWFLGPPDLHHASEAHLSADWQDTTLDFMI
ncbi:hypothetical protein BKA70DRAFT_1224235 [Coprinopsis sp. MPI-PUGE-AT-0042]|nr:hypothetical protein BKA70DRAFT_1224235 [Coprinopsis sp. MPI-PUGE-AT-0042]